MQRDEDQDGRGLDQVCQVCVQDWRGLHQEGDQVWVQVVSSACVAGLVDSSIQIELNIVHGED